MRTLKGVLGFFVCLFLFFWWGWVGEGFWRREVSISWTRGGAGSSRTRMGSSLSHSYSMSGMGLPLSLQLVLLRSKSWVKILVVVHSLSCVWLFVTPWTGACQAALSFTISWSLLKFMSTESVMPSNHLILCHPLLLPLVFPSVRVFSSESALRIRWPKYWSFSFNIRMLLKSPFIFTRVFMRNHKTNLNLEVAGNHS